VTRIVTPGTLTDASLLEDKADNILLSLSRDKSTVGLAGCRSRAAPCASPKSRRRRWRTS